MEHDAIAAIVNATSYFAASINRREYGIASDDRRRRAGNR
jgi:hypothetical protein